MKVPTNFKKIFKLNVLILFFTIILTYCLNFSSKSINGFIINSSENYSKNIDMSIIFKILFNNLMISVIIILSGIMIILPLAILIININAYIIQFLLVLYLDIPMKFILLFGVPHIIFEFTAMLISTSIAMYIPYSLFNYIYFKNDIYLKKENLLLTFELFLISIFLLIIASIIEGGIIYNFKKSIVFFSSLLIFI